MNKTKKVVSNKKSVKSHPAPVVNNDLEKYHNDPVVLKKIEQAKRMVGEI